MVKARRQKGWLTIGGTALSQERQGRCLHTAYVFPMMLRVKERKKKKSKQVGRVCDAADQHAFALAAVHIIAWWPAGGAFRVGGRGVLYVWHRYLHPTQRAPKPICRSKPPTCVQKGKSCGFITTSTTTTSFGGKRRVGGTGRGDKGMEGGEGRRLLHLSQVRLGAKGRRSSFPRLRLGAKKAAGWNGENLNDKTSCSWRAGDTLLRNENN